MHKLQQQTNTLTAENQTLKSVIRDMQNQLISPSTTTQNNTSASQFPGTDKSPTVQKSSKREVTAGLETTNGKRTSTGSSGQQRAQTSATPPKPAVCNAATATRQRTMQDSRPAATSGHVDSTSPVTAISPRQRLAELRVAPGVANVLIGDSVARPIKPGLLFPGGLAIDDVNHWLANIPRNREVRRVVIHIGVNTCKFAVIMESMWRQLIRKLKHVFPEAAVLVSSIVPAMGRLRKTVQVSSAALLAVCSREKVSVVDHTDAFTAQSGAPRKDLYRDQVHPSDRGVPRKDLYRNQVHPSDSGAPRKDLYRDQVHPSDRGVPRKDLYRDQVHPSDSGAPRKDLYRDQVHPSDSGAPRKDLYRDQVHPSDSGTPRKDLYGDQVHPSDGAPRKDLYRDQVHPSDRGVPRKDLYGDQVHPSDSGTSRLVFNLQLGTGTRHRPAQQKHQPGSRPHHRLVGLVVKASASRAGGPRFESR